MIEQETSQRSRMLITQIKTVQRLCQGDGTEDIMAANIQPPVMF